jgi:hypothetical protein
MDRENGERYGHPTDYVMFIHETASIDFQVRCGNPPPGQEWACAQGMAYSYRRDRNAGENHARWHFRRPVRQ